MRNLITYPVTKAEIEQCLLSLADELSREERIGDMRPLFLRCASVLIYDSKADVENIGTGRA